MNQATLKMRQTTFGNGTARKEKNKLRHLRKQLHRSWLDKISYDYVKKAVRVTAEFPSFEVSQIRKAFFSQTLFSLTTLLVSIDLIGFSISG